MHRGAVKITDCSRLESGPWQAHEIRSALSPYFLDCLGQGKDPLLNLRRIQERISHDQAAWTLAVASFPARHVERTNRMDAHAAPTGGLDDGRLCLVGQ